MTVHLPAWLAFLPLAEVWPLLILGFFSYRLSRWGAYAALLLQLGLAASAFPRLLQRGPWHYSVGGWPPPWGIEWVLTPFTVLTALFLLLLGLAALFYLGPHGLRAGLRKERESLAAVLLVALVSSLCDQLWTTDGWVLYLLLETSLLAAAGLWVALSHRGWSGGFYLLLGGSLGASLLLTGFLFLFSATGTFQYDDLLSQLFISRQFGMALAAGTFLVLAWAGHFAFPLPFFSGRQPVQAPSFLLGFFSAAMVRTGVFVLFVLLFSVLDVPGTACPKWLEAGEILLLLPFFGGFVLAARQRDFLRSAAFLGAAQLAFPLLGFFSGDKSSLTGALVEILAQMPVVAGLFMAAGVLQPGPEGACPWSRLAGLGRRDFGMALTLTVLAFSAAGVPPTGGAFGKFYLFQGLFEGSRWALIGLLALAVLFNLFLAGRFLWFLFKPGKAGSSGEPVEFSVKVPLYLCALLVLVLGVFHHEIVHYLIEPTLPKAFQDIPLPKIPFLGKEVE
jgi:multicomponent Na+:H+ antiporter subunit D